MNERTDIIVAEHGVTVREHERRLNTVNGHMERLADSVDALIVQQAEWRATVRTWGLVLGVVLGVISPIVSALTVYLIVH